MSDLAEYGRSTNEHRLTLRGRRTIGFGWLIFWSLVVGAFGGVVAAAYYYVLNGSLFLVWDVVEKSIYQLLPDALAATRPVWIVTALGGLLVGLALKWLGTPGEISAVVDNIHVRRGRIDVRQTPAMLLTSLLSISFGGSAGPEAPLVQIIGSAGSWIGDKLRLLGTFVRTLTFCGMAAALGAFFGAPLGGALFALEIPHRRGLEYYEALVPAVVAAVLSYIVFRALVGVEGVLYHFNAFPAVTLLTVAQAVVLGLVGAAVGVTFVMVFRTMGRVAERFERHTVALAVCGGLAIGLIAWVMPADVPATTLFWGEFQAREIISSESALLAGHSTGAAVGLLFLLAAAKILAVGFTLHSGFRGGFIFPLFFIGAAVGLAISMGTQHLIAPSLAMLCVMAAVNVAVTKTPISTSVILTTIAGAPMLPVIVAASLTSFLATTRVSLIRTQRSRPETVPIPLRKAS